MAYAIGFAVAILTGLFLRLAGFDRDRSPYPTLVIVIAAYYVLFAAMGGSLRAVGIESIGVIGFSVVAAIGFTRNLWWVVAALAAHGLFDLVHGRLIENPGVPDFWPAFCSAADFGLAAWLAGILLLRRGFSRA